MPIYRLLQNMPMGPEEISRLKTAYESALKTIGLVDRNDPIAEMVAKTINEIGQTGVHDPPTLQHWRSRASKVNSAAPKPPILIEDRIFHPVAPTGPAW
jgi:hypothetical protein